MVVQHSRPQSIRSAPGEIDEKDKAVARPQSNFIGSEDSDARVEELTHLFAEHDMKVLWSSPEFPKFNYFLLMIRASWCDENDGIANEGVAGKGWQGGCPGLLKHLYWDLKQEEE